MAVTHAPKPKPSPKAARQPESKPKSAPPPRPAPPRTPVFLGGSARSGGQSLPPSVQTPIESSLQVNLDSVRVHTDAGAQQAAANASARAFTYGRDIFLGRGERSTDLGLMAHEAAHVVQQQGAPSVQKWSAGAGDSFEHEAHQASAAVMSGQAFTVHERTSKTKVQRLGISDALDYFADKAYNIPGYRMFTILLGVNPINMSRVERSAANILRAIVEFLPGGHLITEALDKYGVFDKVGTWIEQQLSSLGITGSAIKQAVSDFLDSLSWRDIFHLGSLWDRAKRIFTDPIDRIITFAKNLFDKILQFIKDAILRPLAALASQTPAWDLICAIIGKNPITGDPVPRTAETLIGGFMKLIGQEEIWQNIKKANAISRAWQWFQDALSGLVALLKQIPSMFLDALRSLELSDIILLPRAFVKVGKVFLGFAGKFISWAGNTIWNLLEIIFSVLAPAVIPYLKKAAGAFRSILKNPIGFVGNLVKAGIQGFKQFASNFLTHLKKSLIDWLTGTLSGAGVYIPQGFTVMEIIKFVLSVLGLTWANIRQKLVKRIGETAVKALEIGFDLIKTLITEGPAAAWQKILEGISNLKEMVMEGIMGFVKDRIVQAAITKLLTSLNPAGAFIQAIIAIYNTIMFFIERLKQIAQVAAAFIDSIAAIANGVIAAAANKVENTMGGLLTLVISFLARLVGLGKVSDAVKNIIDKVRAPIDKALDRVIDWIIEMAKKAGKALLGAIRGKDERTPEQKQKDLDAAVQTLRPQVAKLLDKGVPKIVLQARFAIWKVQHRLTSLTAENGEVVATINPTAKMYSFEEVEIGRMLEPILVEAENQYLAQATGPGTASATRLTAARSDVRAGRPIGQRLSPDEMIQVQRELVSSQLVPAPLLGTNQRGNPFTNLTTEQVQGTRVQLREAGSTAPRQFQSGQGLFVTRAASYNPGGTEFVTSADPTRGGRYVNVQMGNVIASQQAATPGLQQEARDVRFLRDVVEPGRIPSLMASNRVAQGLVGGGFASETEMTVGRMAGASTGYSAAAAMRDFQGATPTAGGRAIPGRSLDNATTVRRGSLAVVFLRLRDALNQAGGKALKKQGGAPMLHLATAFRNWLKAAMPPPGSAPADPAQIERLAGELRSRLVQFMRSQQQGE